jgi:hypothetical protein
MSDTPNLALPEIAPSQAQKHVTHNEALVILDALVQLSVKDRNLNAPPGSPVEGDRYIIGPSPTGAWATHAGKVAYWDSTSWVILTPNEGWSAWVDDENVQLFWDGSSWTTPTPSSGVVATSPFGAKSEFLILEEELTGLSGATVDTTIEIPNGSIVFNVSSRTTTTITGATSYDCGVAGNTGQFGGSLGVAAGSTNKGVIGPTGFYADTPIRLTANGGNFTAGAVRVAIHVYVPTPPTS